MDVSAMGVSVKVHNQYFVLAHEWSYNFLFDVA